MNVPHFEQEKDFSCLPACVRMVLAFLGEHRSENEIRALLKTRPAGTSPVRAMLQLPQWGFDAHLLMASQYELHHHIQAGTPCIVHILTSPLPHWQDETIHAVVVTEINETQVFIHDPVLPDGPIAVPISHFLSAWTATDHLMMTIHPLEGE